MTDKTNLRIQISCSSDPGPNDINQDYFGYRCGNRTVLFENGLFSCAEDADLPLLAAVADGETMISRPDHSGDDSASVAVRHLLNQQFDNFFDAEGKYYAADAVNECVVRQAALIGYDLCASLAAIGLHGNSVHTMYLGNCAIIHIHDGKLNLCTPLKMSSFTDTYAGNDTMRGREMAVFREYPLCKGDTWILMTDGVSDPFTDINYNLYDDLIMRITKLNPVNPAQVLVRISGETYDPIYTTNLCSDNRTAIVIHIDEI